MRRRAFIVLGTEWHRGTELLAGSTCTNAHSKTPACRMSFLISAHYHGARTLSSYVWHTHTQKPTASPKTRQTTTTSESFWQKSSLAVWRTAAQARRIVR